MPREGAALLTVIFPAYNEAEVIRDTVREVQQHILDRVPTSDLIVVDDGSRDETPGILDEIAGEDARIRVIHQPNAGHGSALRRGLEEAGGEYAMLIDADRQIPMDAFDPLWAQARRRDGAFGVRSQRDDPGHRLLLSILIRMAVRALFGVRLLDANVPFKIFRREIWEEARPLIPCGTLAPSLFFAIYTAARKLDVVHLEVPHRRRRAGEQSLSLVPLLRFCLPALGQLLRFRRELSQAQRGPR